MVPQPSPKGLQDRIVMTVQGIGQSIQQFGCHLLQHYLHVAITCQGAQRVDCPHFLHLRLPRCGSQDACRFIQTHQARVIGRRDLLIAITAVLHLLMSMLLVRQGIGGRSSGKGGG